MLPNAETLGREMEEKSWAEIASLARSLQIRLEESDDEAKNLEARLRVIKQSLIEQMQHPSMDSRASEFYTSLSSLMESMEEELMKHDIERHEFVEFLRALLSKLKSEKVKSGTPRKATFTRHKK